MACGHGRKTIVFQSMDAWIKDRTSKTFIYIICSYILYTIKCLINLTRKIAPCSLAITFTSKNYVKMRNCNFPRGKKKGKFNGMAPSRGYNSASGDLFGLKLTENIEQKLRKTMLA